MLIRPTRRGRVRRGAGRDHRGDAGAARAGRQRRRPRSTRAGERLSASSTRSTGRSTRPRAERRRRPARRAADARTPRRPNSRRWCARAKDYIAAGDIFQVVLSQRFEAPFALPPFSLYRALRRVNPVAVSVLPRFRRLRGRGSSPEILVRVRDGTVTIRPIAGTRPRGATPHEDKALEDELLADPKERAEHLMLLDLGRNDVGRVAEIGTRQGHRPVLHRALQPRDAHRLQRRGQARAGARRARRARRRLSGRHGVRRAEGARDADHRRAGEGKARALRRLRRLFLAPPARWTPASCCAPRWSRTA